MAIRARIYAFFQHRRMFGRFAVAIASLLIAGWGAALAADDTGVTDALIAAAKKEGEVVIYSSEADKQVADTSRAFAAKYGIKIQGTKLTGGTIASRYSGERQGNTVVADAVVVANDPFITDNPSWWVPLSETVVPGYDKFPANDKSPLWITINHNMIAIAWNTNLVKGPDVPKGYEDLADNPAFAQKGSVVYADPRATPNAMSLFKILVDKYGEGYFKKLRDRGVAISAAGPAGAQQIAAGAAKVMVGIMSNNAQTVIAAGAPVAYLSISNPATGSENRVALSSGAKHPNAARLYAAWRISEEGQRVMCLAGGSSSPLGELPGCEPPTPADYIAPDNSVASDKTWQAKYLPLLGLKPL